MPELTLASVFGVVLYALTATLCALCVLAAMRTQKPTSEKINWTAITLFFVGLILLRGFLIEDNIEQAIRQTLRDGGDYASRRHYQSAIAISLVGVMAVAAFLGYRIFARLRGRIEIIVFAANAACAAMIGLILLRVLSLHAIDRILYGFRINWIVDIGVTIFVGACAVGYIGLARSQPKRRQPTDKASSKSHVARSIRRGPSQ